MRVGSLFTGVGGFDLGLERAGHEIVWQVEYDKQARSVLRRHWPNVDLYEDVRDVEAMHSLWDGEGADGVSQAEREAGREALVVQGVCECREEGAEARSTRNASQAQPEPEIRPDTQGVGSDAGEPGRGVRDLQDRDGEGVRGPLPHDGGGEGAAVPRLQHQAACGGGCGLSPRRPQVLEPVDVICGGFPCQDLSVAGKRAGLGGDRSSLFFEFMRIVGEMRSATDGRSPTFVVIENVPGLLNSNRGRDFAVVLARLGELGAMDIAWGVLDSQHFGVAQRRRRVFVVADFGGERAAEVLAIAEGLSGHPAPSRETGAGIASRVEAGVGAESGVAHAITSREGKGPDSDCMSGMVLANALGASGGGPDDNAAQGNHVVAHTLRGEGFDASEDGTGRGTPIVAQAFNWQGGGDRRGLNPQDSTNALLGQVPAVYRKAQKARDPDDGERWEEARHANTLAGHSTTTSEIVAFQHHGSNIGPPGTLHGDGSFTSGSAYGVVTTVPRRLTPRECERLQGFPDDWTRWDADGNELADSPRYRMMGNAVSVPVAEWIGRRIA